MNYNIYFSPTGGTKRVADILVKGLGGEFQEMDLCHEPESVRMTEEEVNAKK